MVYLFICLFVCMCVCLLATFRKNYELDQVENWYTGASWSKEDPIKFWWWSGSCSGSRIRKTLIQRISETNIGIFMKFYPRIKSFYQNCLVKYGKNLDQIPWRRYALPELLFLLSLLRYYEYHFFYDNILWNCIKSNEFKSVHYTFS